LWEIKAPSPDKGMRDQALTPRSRIFPGRWLPLRPVEADAKG